MSDDKNLINLNEGSQRTDGFAAKGFSTPPQVPKPIVRPVGQGTNPPKSDSQK